MIECPKCQEYNSNNASFCVSCGATLKKKSAPPSEYRKRCNVCGKIFCYTNADLLSNEDNEKFAKGQVVGSVLAVLSGNAYLAAENSKQVARSRDRIVDYNRCPSCNSTNLSVLPDEEFEKMKQAQSAPAAGVISVADELKKFRELLDMGIISQAEFDKKKKQLLGV